MNLTKVSRLHRTMRAPKRLPAVSDWLQQLRILSTTKHDDLVRWWTSRSLLGWLTNVNATITVGLLGRNIWHCMRCMHKWHIIDIMIILSILWHGIYSIMTYNDIMKYASSLVSTGQRMLPMTLSPVRSNFAFCCKVLN